MANLQESDINGALFLAPEGNVVRLVSIIRQPIGIVRDIKTGKQKQITRQDFYDYRRLVPEKRQYRRKPDTQQPQLNLDTAPVNRIPDNKSGQSNKPKVDLTPPGKTKTRSEALANTEDRSLASGKKLNLDAAPVSQVKDNKSGQSNKPEVKTEPTGKLKARAEAPARPKVKSGASGNFKARSGISGQSRGSTQKPGKEKTLKPAAITMPFNEAVDKFWLKIVDKKAAIGNVSVIGTTIQEAVVAVFNKVGIKCDIAELREMTDKVPDSSSKKLIKSIIDIPRKAT
jgi:hypothetical protein